MKTRCFLLPVILIAAIFYKAVYIFIYLKYVPYAREPFIDGLDFVQKAHVIITEGMLHPSLVQKPPLYPLFLAAYFLIFDSLVPLMVIQAVMGLFSAYIAYLIGRELEGERTGLAAAFISAFYFPYVFYEVKPLATALVIFLSHMFIFVVVKFKKVASRFSAGVILGLLITLNPNLILFAPAGFFWFLFKDDGKFYSRIKISLLFSSGLFIIVIPFAVQNTVATGEIIPFSSNGGITFYHGNNPGSDGLASMGILSGDLHCMHAEAEYIAEEETGRPMSLKKVDRFWYLKGFDFIRSLGLPGFLAHLSKKLLISLNNYEFSNAYSFNVEKKSLPFVIPGIPTFLILAMSAVGFICMKREEKWLLLFFGLTTFLTMLIFYSGTRYRLPAFPVLIIFAASASAGFRGIWEKRRWCFAAGVILLAVSVYPVSFALGKEAARDFYQNSLNLVKLGNYEKLSAVLNEFNPSENDRKTRARIHWFSGLCLADDGQFTAAEQEFRNALDESPVFYPAYISLGRMHHKSGNIKEAISILETGYSVAPFFTETMRALCEVHLEAGNYEDAAFYIEKADLIEPCSFKNVYLHAKVYFHKKSYMQAEKLFRKSIIMDPSSEMPCFYLSVIYAQRGDWGKARAAYRKYIALSRNIENNDMLKKYLLKKRLEVF